MSNKSNSGEQVNLYSIDNLDGRIGKTMYQVSITWSLDTFVRSVFYD